MCVKIVFSAVGFLCFHVTLQRSRKPELPLTEKLEFELLLNFLVLGTPVLENIIITIFLCLPAC